MARKLTVFYSSLMGTSGPVLYGLTGTSVRMEEIHGEERGLKQGDPHSPISHMGFLLCLPFLFLAELSACINSAFP